MKKYYYHITDNENWGDSILLKPKRDGFNRDSNEPHTPRICVCPTIEQCMIAIYLSYGYSVYRTKHKEVAISAKERIFDGHITHEHWLKKPTQFIKVGTFNKRIPYNFGSSVALGDGTKESENWQRNMLNKLRKKNLSFLTINKKFAKVLANKEICHEKST